MYYDFMTTALIFGCIAGMVCGAIPLIAGAVKNHLGIGFLGFFACTVGGLMLGLLLAIPLAGVFTWWVFHASNKQKQQAASQQYKRCRYCSETILVDARVCRYCGRDLTASSPV